MRSKLERIASGKIEYAKIPLKLSAAEISLTVEPGGRAGGSFSISSDRVIKGVIYSSSTRMCLENHGFQARITRVNYIFDAAGLWGGEEIEGGFCIICEAGERIVPFKVKVGEHVYPAEDYTYFVTADPIEPDTRGSQAAKIDTSVMLTGGAADPESETDIDRLTSVISLLIKNGNTAPGSFAWYKRGVEEELKLTNLYEYFMMTVPDDYMEKLPANLLLYFQMENHLGERQKALLYANVIRYVSPLSDIYRGYADEIEEFMLDQLLKRHISKNLAVIYGEFLMEGLLTIDFAEALSDIMFLRLLKCSDRRIREVQVFYDQLKNPVRIPMNGGQAYVPIYTPGAVILLADAKGNLYSSSVPYTLEKLIDERRYVNKCRELLRYHQGLYLYLCDGSSKYHHLTAENVENYKRILKISGFTEKYREEVRQEILQYYYDNHVLDDLDREFFLTETAMMNPKDKGRYTEILILRGLYGDAWDIVTAGGYTFVKVSCLIKLAVWRISKTEYAEDDFLTELCLYIFEQHKYNEGILEYLAWYYSGPVSMMLKIWMESRAFEINVFELEERILAQMLFTDNLTADAFEVYRDYRRNGGGALVERAFLCRLSYDDFILETAPPSGFYDYLEDAVNWDENLGDVCLLAYLRYLSGRRNLSARQSDHAKRLMERFLKKKVRYGFMKALGAKLGRPWTLEDRIFAEYRCDPAHKVVIHYCIEVPGEDRVDYVTERVYPQLPGVFVKEFTLFYGWRLTWFISETDSDGNEVTTRDRNYTENSKKEFRTGTKYACIYEMSRELASRSTYGLESKLMEYGEKNFLVESLFTLK